MKRQPDGADGVLRARIAELEAEIRARDDFLAIAAHELRNPMTPIAARVEFLAALARRSRSRVPPEILTGLQRLEHLVDAYIRRATTFLDVARIRSGNLRLEATPLDLSDLVRETAAAMLPAAERAGCTVTLAIEDGVSGVCDRTAIEQIVENILSNAIRYGPEKPIEIALANFGPTARLTVRDFGIGISEADRELIFERFGRAQPGNANGGFGVGLWITRQLVRAMGGDIAVASNLGAGATFIVSLPLEQA